MPTHRHRRRRVRKATVEPSLPFVPYDVGFSNTAADIYGRLHKSMMDAEARGDTSSNHHTVFRMVEDTIKNVIPRDPINKKYGLSGPLSRFFRIKKGRHRICWAVSSEKRKVIILFISETLRKEGDVNDPYNIFTKLVMSGKFDDVLSQLAGAAPPRNFPAAPLTLQ
jgi:mRNA-degrading endonuclease RelE of RelBE toxin-antitoxin system